MVRAGWYRPVTGIGDLLREIKPRPDRDCRRITRLG
jgi:hypothetical protein